MTAVITFDINWAPDFVIEMCANICQDNSVGATFFATHGRLPTDVMAFCMDIVPDAKCMRTHSLVQSWPILGMIADEYPQI